MVSALVVLPVSLYILMIFLLRIVFGRPWLGPSGRLYAVTGGVWRGSSQHLLDVYSIQHVAHGVINVALIYGGATIISPQNEIMLPDLAMPLTSLSMMLGILWEIVENSSYVVQRFRVTGSASEYSGDTIANSASDVFCCGLGTCITLFMCSYTQSYVRVFGVLLVVLELLSILAGRECMLFVTLSLVMHSPMIYEWQRPVAERQPRSWGLVYKSDKR